MARKFVLLRELIHIARHLKADLTAVYDDLDVKDATHVQEQVADQLAGEALIPETSGLLQGW